MTLRDAVYCVAVGIEAQALGFRCIAIGDHVAVIEQEDGSIEVDAPDDHVQLGDRLVIGPTLFGEPLKLAQVINAACSGPLMTSPTAAALREKGGSSP